MTAVVIIEGVVIVLLAVLVGGLLKSHAEILRQLHALGVDEDGSVATSASMTRPKTTGFEKAPSSNLIGVGTNGDPVTISLEQGRGNTLVAFLSSTCSSCQIFWSELSGNFDLPAPDTRTVIVTKGPDSESPSKVASLAPPGLPLVMSTDSWDTFRVPMTPYFMLVTGDGNVAGEGAASSWSHLIGLLRQSVADASPVTMSTEDRTQFTDMQLGSSGIKPGDESLYQNPLDQ